MQLKILFLLIQADQLNFCSSFSLIMQCLKSAHDTTWSEYFHHLQAIFVEADENESLVLQYQDSLAALKHSMIAACYKYFENGNEKEFLDDSSNEIDSLTSLADLFIFLKEKDKTSTNISLNQVLTCSLFQALIHCLTKHLNLKDEFATLRLTSLAFQLVPHFKKTFLDVIFSLHSQYFATLNALNYDISALEEARCPLFFILHLLNDKTIQKCLSFMYDWTSLLKDSFLKLNNASDQMNYLPENPTERVLNVILDSFPTYALPTAPGFSDLKCFLSSPFCITLKKPTEQSFLFLSDHVFCHTVEQLISVLLDRMLTALQRSCLESFEYSTLSLHTLVKKISYIAMYLNINVGSLAKIIQYLFNQQYYSESCFLAFKVCACLLTFVDPVSLHSLNKDELLYCLILYCGLLHELMTSNNSSPLDLFTAFSGDGQEKSIATCCSQIEELVNRCDWVIQEPYGRCAVVSVLYTAWSSVCLYTLSNSIQHCVTSFVTSMLRWSIENLSCVSKQTSILLIWVDFGRKLRLRRDAYRTFLITLLYHGLSLDLIEVNEVPSASMQSPGTAQNDSLHLQFRSYITLYPSSSQRYLVNVVFPAVVQLRDSWTMDFILCLTENLLRRLSGLIEILLGQQAKTKERETLAIKPENIDITVKSMIHATFSVHHLIFVLKQLLKMVCNTFKQNKLGEVQRWISQIVLQLTCFDRSKKINTSFFNIPSATGRWSGQLVQLDLLCSFLDFVFPNFLLTNKTSLQLALKAFDLHLSPKTSCMMYSTLVPWVPRVLIAAWTVSWVKNSSTYSENQEKHTPESRRVLRQCILLLHALVSYETQSHCEQCRRIGDILIAWWIILLASSPCECQSSIKLIAGDLTPQLKTTLQNRKADTPYFTLYHRLTESLESATCSFTSQDLIALIHDELTPGDIHPNTQDKSSEGNRS